MSALDVKLVEKSQAIRRISGDGTRALNRAATRVSAPVIQDLVVAPERGGVGYRLQFAGRKGRLNEYNRLSCAPDNYLQPSTRNRDKSRLHVAQASSPRDGPRLLHIDDRGQSRSKRPEAITSAGLSAAPTNSLPAHSQTRSLQGPQKPGESTPHAACRSLKGQPG